MIGKTISHYKIIEEIGAGGMGIVYKAEDSKLKRTVALKFLPPELTRDKAAKDRLLHEARAAAALEHSNICPVYEINETADGQMYMVMAYYEGETLESKIAARPLPLTEVLNIFVQTASGLHKAHQKGIIHRDIKPANIMITDEGVPKILDFGLAKLRGQTKLTKEGTTLGTVAYMSPEQTTGEEVDHRTDIWSLGVMFYEMLSGQLPFKGHYEQAVVYSIMNEEPESITRLAPDIPADLEQIINRMLAKDPSRRYQDLTGILADLKTFIKGSSAEMAALKITRPEIGLKRVYKSVAALIMVLVMIIAGYFILRKKPESGEPPTMPTEKPSIAVLYFENDSGDQTLDVWQAGLAKLLITDLSQSRYVDILPVDELHSILKQLKLDSSKNYTAEELAEIGKQARVNHVLTSSFMRAGKQFVITAQLKNLETNQVVHAFKLMARSENELFATVDDMTREIKVRLNLSEEQLKSDYDRSIAEVSTGSPEALKHYLAALASMNLLDQKPVDDLKMAVKLDPEFAMAHSLLAKVYASRWHFRESNDHLKQAVKFADKLPLKERYFIEADFYQKNNQPDKAIDSFKRILEIYPDHVAARNELAQLYRGLGEYDSCIDEITQIKDKQPWAYSFLAHTYERKRAYATARSFWKRALDKGANYFLYVVWVSAINIMERQFSEARQLITGYLEKFSDRMDDKGPAQFLLELHTAAADFYENRLDRAVEEFNGIQKKFPIFGAIPYHYLASAHLVRGRVKDALNYYDKRYNYYKKPKIDWGEIVDRVGSLIQIGSLRLRIGEARQALETIKQADALLPDEKDWFRRIYCENKKWTLTFMALAFLELGDIHKAEELAEEINNLIPADMSEKFPRSIYMPPIFLTGAIALARNQLDTAVENLEKNIDLLPGERLPDYYRNDALILDHLARAYELKKEFHKAINTHRKITELTLGRLDFGDIYARSFYRMGKLYQLIGEKDKAVKNYKKFIELWKECDPEFRPLVEDAKKKLKELAPRTQPS